MSEAIEVPIQIATAHGIDQLAAALAKAQRAMKHAEKSRENPHFKSRYATLADVIDACREPLADNDLSYVQKVSSSQGAVIVETVLMHKSGQMVSATLTMPSQNTAQGIGSALTYARRYGLAAMVGIAPDEDDDGTEASKPAPRRDEPRQEQRREPARSEVTKDDEKKLDAELFAAVKKVTGYLPEQNVASLRRMAGVPAVPAKLNYEQKQIMLRALQQKLKTLEDVETPDDVDGLPYTPGGER